MAKKRKKTKLNKQNANNQRKYYLYTDGSCDNLSGYGEGGYAYALLDENMKIIKQFSKGALGVTNNQMELKAIIEGCKAVPTESADVVIRSDSQYALNVLSGQWKAKANVKLIAEHKINAKRLILHYDWVKGHNGNKFNELVDHLANSEMMKQKALIEPQKSITKPTSAPKSVDVVPQFYVYATSIYNYGAGYAYIVVDEYNRIVKKDAALVHSNYIGVLRAVIEGCKAIPDDNVNVAVISDNEYGINVLSGKWTAKKHFELIQQQLNNEKRFANIIYKRARRDKIRLKETILLASRVLATSMSRSSKAYDEIQEPDNVVYDIEPVVKSYNVAFSAIFDSNNKSKIYCYYAFNNTLTGELISGHFVKILEKGCELDKNMVQTLALTILMKAFEQIPDDAEVNIYSKDCYAFLLEVFGKDESKSFAYDPYIVSMLRYTKSGETRIVHVENSHKGRLDYAIEKESKKIDG